MSQPERDRLGRSRAVYFWWGVVLEVASVLASGVLAPLVGLLADPQDSMGQTPVWFLLLTYLARGFPWLVGLWLAVARIRKGPRIHLVAYVCGVFVVNALLFAAMFGVMDGPRWIEKYTSRIEFGSERWRLNERGEGRLSVRQLMVDDLLDKEILIGMSRAEVTNILGESGGSPPWTGEHWDRAYYLGSGSFLDTEWLAIRFHADGHVIEAEVVSYSG